MGLKRYIVSTVILAILLFGFLYSLELGDYEISLFGYSQILPVSVWIILPFLFLAIATYLHLFFYAACDFFKKWAVSKDHETMIEFINAQLLGKDSATKFRTKKFRELYAILSQLNISVKSETFTSLNEDLNKTVAAVQDINKGKFVKSVKLNENSDLAKQNLLNKIEEQVDFAVDVIKKSENYSTDVVKKAFLKVLSEKTMTTIKKLYKNIKLDKELAQKLFEKDALNNEFGFTQEEILALVKELNFDKKDYLNLAKTYEKILNPDEIISIFEKLSSENDEATTAYLHVLCEFEMIDKLREVLANTQENEFLPFKALLDLKDAGKKYNVETLSYK
ncbi:hypothetical protein [Aliarcobacter butzleri]|uniref:Uroporphyrinogen III synthase HEM4 n=1 Tax=Aliarcobacter butzleri TaxID=28197 RepID=A0AAW7PN97_9BACT|nr:hypothetical protein [Aliarcobacter butzleri]MCT7562806.1 hypothetical protein [Aliarcobacter butzleri]MCT7576966.1 hypothetical protein [Aliarcobacter butzleri]MCT7578344.1 hypothetical protein [Aliarcobacter butzleri]MCT7611943.1 hypothetical protein [Aliarcobacter butzleri]MCT7640469.1 hypothetical protein [Aliarcobacter butzleri]